MNIRHAASRLKQTVARISPRTWLIAGGVLLVGAYSLAFFVPRSVQFSYAEPTCVRQFTLAPGLQRMQSDEFSVQFDQTLSVGGLVIASAGYCVTPTETPSSGTQTASIAPFGGIIARSHMRIAVPEAPVANTTDLVGQKISTARPLEIGLSSQDVVHEYSLVVDDASTGCESDGAELLCDVADLKLKQGASYTAALERSFKDESTTLAEGDITTLEPLALKKSSISNKQTIYTIPTSANFTFDETITEAEATLKKQGSDAETAVAIERDDTTLKVSFEPLDRNATYDLTLTQVVGESGRSLDQSKKISFTLSGGPKVKSVSVAQAGVPRSAAIVVTLDQPLQDDADLAKYASVSGVSGSVARGASDKELIYTINGGDCTPFTLTLAKGAPSGSNNETSSEDWAFKGRTICGTSWTIGSSVQGRPIVAYSFGSGKTTILFTAAVHGSEPSSYSTMLGFVQHLQMYGDVVPADKRIVIVPNTNPDGIAMGTRYNANNVNLGRNFPTANWSASIETASGKLPKGGGASAGSEPETKAMMALTQQLRPRLEVSYHAQGSLVGANKYGDSTAVGDMYAGTVGYATMYYNAEAVMGYPMTGEYEDWMGESMGVPAILIELPTHNGNYFSSQWPAIQKVLNL